MKTPDFSLPPCVSGCCTAAFPAETFSALERIELPASMRWSRWEPLEASPNYTYGVVQLSTEQGQTLDMAAHKYFPLLAPVVAQWNDEGKPLALAFREWGEEAAFFRENFRLLEPEWLILKPDPHIPVAQRLLKDLRYEEFAQFSFFQPENIGEIVFNNWETH